MKNLFHRILKTLNINGRDWVVLLLALLLAFSIWMIHNLSLKYNDYMSVPVIARSNIPGHTDVSSGKTEVTARCRATGYKVIRSFLRRDRNVEVSFRAGDLKHKEGDIFYVTTTELKDYAHQIFGPEVSVEYYVTDTLFFRFPVEKFKKVPVHPISTITYRNQFMADGPLVLQPDSVMVYGEPFRLENINAVYTRPINFTDLSRSRNGLVRLEKIKGVRLSESEIRYSLNVRRFVEIVKSVPVTVVNVPEGKEMLVYPSVVDVCLRCAFPLLDDPESGLRIEADYEDIQNSIGGQCILKASELARGVISCEMSPMSVSFVLEAK